jgi:predicted nicotinamide N-methyase
LDPAAFVRRNTQITVPPLVPEIRLHLATEVTPLWQATQETLAHSAVPPPFWAFAWAGGQALARDLLDHPEQVAERFVLDFGAGSGLVAIAAAIVTNAALNGVSLHVTTADVIDTADARWQVVTAGDVCYEQPMADRVAPWLWGLAQRGRLVLLGDPGRTYLPAEGLRERGSYLVPTSPDLEDRETRDGVVWQVLAS